MRWARARRRNLLFFGLTGLLLAAWGFGPSVGLPFSSWFFLVGALAVPVVSILLTVRTFRAMRDDAARVVVAHPDQVAFASGISSWPGADRAERERVIVVAADRRGLSFRDHDDRELLLVPPDSIMSLELAPLDPRAGLRPLRVTTIDGSIDFSGPLTPDQQVDAVVALRTALGRATG